MPLTKTEYLNRFTIQETAAILAASDVESTVRVYLFKLQQALEVDVSDPVTVAGVQALEAAGLIGAGRAAVILEPPPTVSDTPTPGLRKEWTLTNEAGVVDVTVIADTSMRGVSLEAATTWWPYRRIEQMVSLLNTANAWLIENGGVV